MTSRLVLLQNEQFITYGYLLPLPLKWAWFIVYELEFDFRRIIKPVTRPRTMQNIKFL